MNYYNYYFLLEQLYWVKMYVVQGFKFKMSISCVRLKETDNILIYSTCFTYYDTLCVIILVGQ